MCEVGRIQHHLIHNISGKANTILIVGYMGEGTLGRRIRDGAKEVRIHGDFFRVNAAVEAIDAFSAHADWKETLDWLKGTDLSRLKKAFLVHGEGEALTSMKEKVLGVGVASAEIVKAGEIYSL